MADMGRQQIGKPVVGGLPDPTVALFLVAATAALMWTFAESLTGAITLIAVVLGTVLVFVLASSFEAAVITLMTSTVTSHFIFPLAGVNVSPEHLVIILLCLGLPIWLSQHRERPSWNQIDKLLLLYIGLNFFSSAFFSIKASQTVRWAMQQALAMVPYFLLRYLITDRAKFKRAFDIFLAIGVLQAVYAIVSFFSNRIFETEFGVAGGQYGTIPGFYGVQREANILGAYSAACFLILVVMYFKTKQRKFLVGSALTYAALMISLTRAAVGALIIVLPLMLFYFFRTKVLTKQLFIRLASAIVITNLILSPVIASLYTERLSTVEVSDPVADADVQIRVIEIGLAFDDIVDRPIFGNGTASFQLHVSYDEIGYVDMDAGTWISTIEIRILHDTGIVGFIVFMLFLYFLGLRAWKVAAAEHSPELLGFLFATLIYCITFQATEATMMAFTWVHLGMIASGVAVYESKRIRPAALSAPELS
jgi:O-antigen ligase